MMNDLEGSKLNYYGSRMPYNLRHISPLDEPRNAAERWTRVLEIYLEVLERADEGRHIEKLGDELGLGDGYTESSAGWILRTAPRLDPERALAFYKNVNPEIDLERLARLSPEEQYKVAEGLVFAFAQEEGEEDKEEHRPTIERESGNIPEAPPTTSTGASPEQRRQFQKDKANGTMGRLLVEALNKGALKDQEDEANS